MGMQSLQSPRRRELCPCGRDDLRAGIGKASWGRQGYLRQSGVAPGTDAPRRGSMRGSAGSERQSTQPAACEQRPPTRLCDNANTRVRCAEVLRSCGMRRNTPSAQGRSIGPRRREEQEKTRARTEKRRSATDGEHSGRRAGGFMQGNPQCRGGGEATGLTDGLAAWRPAPRQPRKVDPGARGAPAIWWFGLQARFRRMSTV